MITCLYCGYECPDNAHVCPNCGKPIIKTASNRQPALHKEQVGNKKEELHKQKLTIIAACVVLLLIFMLLYKVF